MKTRFAHFDNVDALNHIEKVSPKVSDKYVPIFTSKVIQNLSPEFEFKSGLKFSNANSQHMVYLKYDNQTDIAIANSFDRSRAFSVHLVSNNIHIPLDLDRQIHVGEHAASLTENFKINKSEVVDAIKHAKSIVFKLQRTPAIDRIKTDIINIVFDTPMKRKGFAELDFKIDRDVKTVYTYINAAVDTYIKGEYHIALEKNGKDIIRKGVKINSRFKKICIMNSIYKYIEKELPEVLI